MKKKSPKLTRREKLAIEQAASQQADLSGSETGWSSHSRLSSELHEISRFTVLGAFVIGLMIAVSYLPVLQAGFVWDDTIFVEEPVIHAWSGLWSIWFDPAEIKKEGHYWPIVYTSFWLEHKLWDLAPLGYHVVNLALHWINALLVWLLLARLAVPGAWAVAAIFAVHPLHVESVAWVIERKDLLSSLFYLSAFLTWTRYVEAPTWRRYWLALALFIAGLLSKSVVVTFPAALLVWHWWQQGRLTALDLRRLAPFFIVGLVITLGDLWYYTNREVLSLDYSIVERVLIASRALGFYVAKLLWPTDLMVIYPLWEIRENDPLGWAFVVTAVAVPVLLWLARHHLGRGPLAAMAFFTITLSPALGFVDYGYMQFAFVADRFQYLAGIGFIAAIIGGLAHTASRLPHVPVMATGAALAVVLAILGAMTWIQSAIYRDEVAFFGYIIERNPAARGAYMNFVNALHLAGREEEALDAARKAVTLYPDSAEAHSSVSFGLIQQQRFAEAESHARRALEIDPRLINANQNLGEALRRSGRYEEAVEAYHKALKLDSNYALAHAGLGDALFSMQRHEEAVATLERALSLGMKPKMTVGVRNRMGEALEILGRLDEAAAQYQRVLAIQPLHPATLTRLANVRHAQGRNREADDYLRQLRDSHPNDAKTLLMAADELRKKQRYEEAIDFYRAILDIDQDSGNAHAGLGHVQFAVERYEEAFASLTRSLTLEPESSATPIRHLIAGRAAQALDRVATASEHFERAVDLGPDNFTALDYLALIRFEQKRYREAHELYRKMIVLQPDNAQTHANLGATLYHLDRSAEALGSFNRALELDPDLAAARTGREAAQARLAKPQVSRP